MISSLERTIAFRYLRSRRAEGFVSVTAGFSLAGICLGVGALIVVMSVMNGFRHELLSTILGFNGHITISSPVDGIAGFEELVEELEAIDGVEIAIPMIVGQVLAASPRNQSGILIRGVSPADLAQKSLVADSIRAGRIDRFGDTPGIVAGDRLLWNLGLRVGETMTLISPNGITTAFGTMPRAVSYPVLAAFNVGMYEFDSRVIYMPLDLAQTYLRQKESVTHIELQIALPEEPAAVREAVRDLLDRTDRSEVAVADWQQSNHHVYNALQVERNVMFLILTLIILVAAFNIISSLILLVKDKNGDIAILRTMGASRRSLLKIFLLTGACIGIAGTVLGLALGVLFCVYIEEIRQFLQSLTGTELFPAEIYFLSRLPARVDWGEVVVIVVMALGLTFLAALYPAWRAARVEPAEALRNA